MAPPKGARPPTTQIDSPIIGSLPKSKPTTHKAAAGSSRKPGQNNTSTTAHTKDMATKDIGAILEASGTSALRGTAGGAEDDFTWLSAPTPLLLNYRSAYSTLPPPSTANNPLTTSNTTPTTTGHTLSQTPTCFSNPLASALLTCGIGKSSPTMLAPTKRRRVPKETLAKVVGQSFRDGYGKEMDIMVQFSYRGRMKGRAFRRRFGIGGVGVGPGGAVQRGSVGGKG